MSDVNTLESAELSRTVRFVKFLREAVAIKTKRVLEVHRIPERDLVCGPATSSSRSPVPTAH